MSEVSNLLLDVGIQRLLVSVKFVLNQDVVEDTTLVALVPAMADSWRERSHVLECLIFVQIDA